MKGLSELTDFYYKTLFPTLEELEKNRKQLRYRIILIGTFYTFFVAILLYFIFENHLDVEGLAFSGIAYIGVGGFIYKLLIKDYTKEFKEKIIRPLISSIDEKLSYLPESHIPSQYFTRSKLFTSTPDRVNGNDYVTGKIDNVNIQFSDFHAEKRHKDSEGRTSWSTIFQGLFIISEFNKNFHGSTVVLPDSAQSSFGDLVGHWLQSNNFGRDELVKMDDVAFEKEFVVYSSDQVEARYILTHTLMKKLLDYKKRSKHPVYVSFNSKNVHMAIEYNKDLFEPSVFHSLLKYKIAMEYVSTLHLAIGIVEELKLNQKLWSKL
ncbi:MAG: DUF3137 domain-containing protein [Campylobacterota bacterium]|nr:DUF3137 domain-containing protein [Campylobacterota bacterium]